MLATLDLLGGIEFDVLLANTSVTNPVCHVEFDGDDKDGFLAELRADLS